MGCWFSPAQEMAATAEARGGDFPVGMKVLVVDDDPTCLVVLKRMLLECRYDGELTPRPLSFSPRLGFLWRASFCSGREVIGCLESIKENRLASVSFFGTIISVRSSRRRCFVRLSD